MADHSGSEGTVKVGANAVAEIRSYSIDETGARRPPGILNSINQREALKHHREYEHHDQCSQSNADMVARCLTSNTAPNGSLWHEPSINRLHAHVRCSPDFKHSGGNSYDCGCGMVCLISTAK